MASFERNGIPRHPAVWWSRIKVRWPFFVWLAAIAAAAALFLHGGTAGSLSGVVEVFHEDISLLETARLKTLHVREGQQVRKEHVLVEFDASILEVEMEICRLQADLQDVVSREQLRLLQMRRDGYFLRAQRDGTISRVFKQPGEVVAAGEVVLRLVAGGNGRIVSFLPEGQARNVSVGDQGYVESVRSASRRIRATVTVVGPDIVTHPGRVSLIRGQPVRGRRLILTPEEDHGLIPGETVSIRLQRSWFDSFRGR